MDELAQQVMTNAAVRASKSNRSKRRLKVRRAPKKQSHLVGHTRPWNKGEPIVLHLCETARKILGGLKAAEKSA